MNLRSDFWSAIDWLRRKLAGRFRPMTAAELRDHIYKTYFLLRIGLCVLGVSFPILLVLYGLWYSIPIQSSMSDYYFASANIEFPDFPVRVWFVGILFAIGSFLVLYKGLNRTEDRALNIAGASAIIIALFPTFAPSGCGRNCGSPIPWVHNTAGVVLLVSTAFVAWACSEISLGHLSDPKKRQWYRRVYDILAAGIFVAPALAFVIAKVLRLSNWTLLAVEAAGIWAFSAYWIAKTLELRTNDGEVEKTFAQIGHRELGEQKPRPDGKPTLRQRAASFLG